jgi:hypothetical protein
MRNFNDATHVSFVYADPVHIDIMVVQEYYGTVQSSTTTCNHLALTKPTGVTIDYVAVPRIAMPNWETTGAKWFDGWDAAVVYEGKNSSDYLVVTANRITHWAGWIPNSFPWVAPYTWHCGAHTYSSPAYSSTTGTEWISDILNISGINLAHPLSINQINAPLVDLHADGSLRPVVAQAGDFITYNVWNWEDNSSQYSGFDEVLMRRLMLDLDGNTFPSTYAYPNNFVLGNYEISVPTTQDYYLVSDATVSNEQNNIVSVAGTSGHAYFAFIHEGSGSDNIVFKRTVQAPNTAVRKAPIFAQVIQEKEKALFYPNPTQGELWVNSPEKISSLKIVGLEGKLLHHLTKINNQQTKLDLINSGLKPGIFLLEITDETGKSTRHKVSYQP